MSIKMIGAFMEFYNKDMRCKSRSSNFLISHNFKTLHNSSNCDICFHSDMQIVQITMTIDGMIIFFCVRFNPTVKMVAVYVSALGIDKQRDSFSFVTNSAF